MAIRFDNTLQMSNSTDALFRAWVQYVHDTLITTGGWVDPGDTGQTTISTATHPGAINTKSVTRLYRMADALQSTAPVYMKLEYGSNSASANTPGIWVTIGTGSNGTGTITNITFNGGIAATCTMNATTNATSACNSYASASTNRCSFLMFARAASSDVFCWSIERSKDSSGNDTADGLLFAFGTLGAISLTQYIIMTPGTQPPTEIGPAFTLANRITSSFGGNTGFGLCMYFKGVVQQPGLGLIAANDGDTVAEASVTMFVYGANHTFQLGNSSSNQIEVPTGNGGLTFRANTRVGIRYE